MSLIFLMGFFVFVYYMYSISKEKYSYWTKKNIVQCEPWFLFGNFAPLFFQKMSMCDLIKSMYKQFPSERYIGIYQFIWPNLIIRDINLIKRITVKDFETFPERRPVAAEEADPFFAKNITFMRGGEKWQRMRSLLSPTFTSSKLKSMYPFIVKCAKQFVEHYENIEGVVELEIKDTFSKYSNDVITTTAFGIECDSLNNPENMFYRMGNRARPQSFIHILKRFMFISPFIMKISSLVEQHGSAGALRPSAVARVGQAVNMAVERFVTVGETIADDYSEVRQGMYEACKEARQAGGAIERICEEAEEEIMTDRTVLVRAARCLLGSVTRVLLLADIVVVKQLLLAKDKVQRSLGRLESVNNFTEFVKAFSQFGAEMVELAHLTGDRQNDLKDERRRAQMAAARQVLERSTMMLLTSSKTCLRHPDSTTARENRDTVFCQMRRAMDLIHYVVKDGVLNSVEPCSQSIQGEEIEIERSTVYSCMRRLQNMLELCRVSLDPSYQDTLPSALDAVLERTQDFTDSAYTSHEHRQVILDGIDRVKTEVDHVLGMYANLMAIEGASSCPELDSCVSSALAAAKELSRELAQTALQQAQELSTSTKQSQELVTTIRQHALIPELDRLHHTSGAFHDSIDHILEVCKLLRHVAVSETLQVSARFTEINLRVYGPQVITAAKSLAAHPGSKIAQENLEVFADMYQWLVSDVTSVVKEVIEASQARPEKQVYMSLPRPGKHGTTSKPLKSVRLDVEEQEKIAKSGLEMKLMSNEIDAEAEKWQENSTQIEENNDIVKRAKNMSSMAFSMYQFTKGEGSLKTTQDLFTQAEYFAEEANRLYKVIRQFSYQVPGGTNKKELLESLDKVPTFVQRLQFTVKDHTVGKQATFTKVDNVIQETKNLMNVISKVVTTCFECATKYKLEFRGGSGGSGRGSGAEGRSSSGGGASGDNKGGGATGQDQSL